MRVSSFLLVSAIATISFAAETRNWYESSFYLLHEDHHTGPTAAVGADADPVKTERLVNLSKPDMIQIHAKGNPGWTTYPSKIGHVPPKLARDVLGLWRDIARKNGYHWSIYYNIGRDGVIMQRHPEWNRDTADGKEVERALCYHSGVAEAYLWPMIREIMAGYSPDGFWFDGSVFTIRNCYCDACRRRFQDETHLAMPTGPGDPGWSQLHAMQRQIYREFVHKTCELIHSINPGCLVTFNWANSVRMPEKPDSGMAYLTGDIANRVEGLSLEAHWYDGVGLPFDLMTTGHTFQRDKDGVLHKVPKPKPQIEQEMAVIIANGGRFNLWDNPTPTSGISEVTHQALARVVSPFLRSRQPWCLGSKRLPDVSVLHSATAHYALAEKTSRPFDRRDNRIEGVADRLARLHLNYEMVGDWRLADQDVQSPLLIVEHPKKLSKSDVDGLIRFIRSGGDVLLTCMGISQDPRLLGVFGLKRVAPTAGVERLNATVDGAAYEWDHYLYRTETSTADTLLTARTTDNQARPLLTSHSYGQGTAFYVPMPFLTAHGKQSVPEGLIRSLLNLARPADRRRFVTDAPENVEAVLRDKDGRWVYHEVNLAKGERSVERRPGSYPAVTIHSLPSVPPHRVAIRTDRQPRSITLQPQGQSIQTWDYTDGIATFQMPRYDVHQMVVLEFQP